MSDFQSMGSRAPESDPTKVEISLQPLGRCLAVDRGTRLQDVLFAQGVEFPCGGRGRCKGCRIRVLGGHLPVTPEDSRLLSPRELNEGWRLSCQAVAESDLRLDLAQWDAAILADDSEFEFAPRDGLGVAIDLGSTTLVGQLLDLRTGHVLAVRTALNAQARHGSDIMSRIDFAVQGRGQPALERLIRDQIGGVVADLIAAVPPASGRLRDVVLVGNTAMHHLFCGIDITPLSAHPFEPESSDMRCFHAGDLGWPSAIDPGVTVRFLPGLGGFVGSDLLAGVLATRMHEREGLGVLVDLGTNGEIVVGNRDRMLCASTAAGPAFEGARISCGMRAATGAISEVGIVDGGLRCRVIGNAEPRGICGSGLVDAVASALELGLVRPDGRLSGGLSLPLTESVALVQSDIRELQLAKGAIAAGIRILLQQWGATPAEVEQVWLAGAFGNYINRVSARRIGLIDFPPEKVLPAGNTALLGAKLALFRLPSEPGTHEALRSRTRHVSLNEDPDFMDVFVDQMSFAPETGSTES